MRKLAEQSINRVMDMQIMRDFLHDVARAMRRGENLFVSSIPRVVYAHPD